MEAGELVVKECKASEFEDCDLVFSGLDSDVAGTIGISSPWGRESRSSTHFL